MSKNPINAKVLRDSLKDLVNQQPTHIQRWVLVSGDGMSTSPSFVYSWSYVGALVDSGRQVFSNFNTPADDISSKNFAIVIPANDTTPEPRRDDEIILYDMAGNRLGNRWKVNFVQSYYAGSGPNAHRYKCEIHLIRVES